ncbi:hypothetical protein BDW71DRAFT_190419 [Aspergillus fruticulosus]
MRQNVPPTSDRHIKHYSLNRVHKNAFMMLYFLLYVFRSFRSLDLDSWRNIQGEIEDLLSILHH